MADKASDRVRFLALVRTQWKTVPNMLTAARAVLSLYVFVLLIGHSDWAAGVYVVTASTDWVDGWYARRNDQETFLGKLIDPMVDKLLVATAGIGLCVTQPQPWVVIPVGIILAREVGITILVNVYRRKGLILPVTWEGKVKTALQGVVFTLLMLRIQGDMAQLVRYAVVVAVTLTLTSGFDYIARARVLSRPIPAVLPGE